MDIKKLFDKYTDNMAQIYLYQSNVKHNAKNENDQLVRYGESFKHNPDYKGKEIPFSFENMSFIIAQSGEDYNFKFIERSLEEAKNAIKLHRNRQYQWFLVEAYEAFEDFIENAYAFAGYTNNDLWLLSDFGKISLCDLKCKDFQWFVEQVKMKHHKPQSILNQFRDKLPAFKRHEQENKLDINLRLSIAIIEKMRHVVVHNRGTVANKQKFIEEILKSTELWNNGKFDQKNIKLIESLFNFEGHSDLINLLETPVSSKLPFPIYHDRFRNISNYLMTYAHLLVECLKPIGSEELK